MAFDFQRMKAWFMTMVSDLNNNGAIDDRNATQYLEHVWNHGIVNDAAFLVSKINFNKKLSILDVGYGSGYLLKLLKTKKKPLSLSGVEISKKLYIKSCKTLQKIGVKAHNTDFLNLPAYPSYDIVIMSFFLHHVNNPTRYIDHCNKLLLKNGRLVIMDRIAVTDEDKDSFLNYWEEYYSKKHEWREECPNLLTMDEVKKKLSQFSMSIEVETLVPNDNRAGAAGFPKTLIIASRANDVKK